jgi:superfamily II DNA or RNA helicase
VQRIERELQSARSVVAASPCGTGKTLLAMELMYRARQRGESCLFLAPRRELLRQTAAKLDQWAPFGYGMIDASQKGHHNLYLPIQVASVDTLVSRVLKRQRLVLPPIRNVYIDECHLFGTAYRKALIDLFPQAHIVGFTATPGRHDGRALSISFERLIEVTTVKQATREGFLVPAWYKAPARPDLARMKKVAADYNQKQLDERMEPLMGGIVESWLRYAPGARTVVFANKVERSVWLAEQFRAQGVAAEHCDGTADETHRDAVFERFTSGETQVLCNVDLCTYGFDLPAISCIVNAKPTLSVVKYIQMLGRGARREVGKEAFGVLDHAGAVYEHGYYDDDRHWTLAGIHSVTSTRHSPRTGKRRDKVLHLRCPKCTTVFAGALNCPDCGYYFERTAKSFQVVDGELVAVRRAQVEESVLERRLFHAELLGHAQQVSYKPGWAAYTYQSRYKVLPPTEWRWDSPVTPSVATQRYLKYLMIRRARSRAKAVP